jgi:hypothetical protein
MPEREDELGESGAEIEGLLNQQLDSTGRFAPEKLRQALLDFVQLDCDAAGQWVELGPSPLKLHPNVLSSQPPDGSPRPDPCQGNPSLCRIAGVVTDIAIDPAGATDSVIWMATSGGGIWKTEDGGASWKCKTDQLLSVAMGAVAFDPADPSIVYAGTGPIFESPSERYYRSIGLYKSIDGGESWFLCDGGFFATVLRDKGINRIVFPVPNVLLVATGSGLYRSVDGGVNFGNNAPLFNNGKPVREGRITGVATDTQTPGVVHAAVSGKGLFRSSDAGATFPKNLFDGESALPSGYEDVVFAQSTLDHGAPDNTTFYAAVAFEGLDDLGHFGRLAVVLRSKGGSHWLPSLASRQVSALSAENFFSYNMTLGVDPQNPERIYLGTQRLWLSDDGGTDFNQCDSVVGRLPDGSAPFSNFPVHPDHHELVFSPQSHWAADDPRRKAMIDKRIADLQKRLAAFTRHDQIEAIKKRLQEAGRPRTTLIVGTDGGIYRNLSADADLDGWEALHANGIGSTLVYGVEIARGLPQKTIMAGLQDNGTAFFDGVAREWTEFLGGDGFRSLAIDPVDPKRRYSQSTKSLVRSVDGGLEWPGMDVPGKTEEWRDRGFAMERSGASATQRRLYAWIADTLSRSDDGGNSFSAKRTFAASINCVGMQPHNPSVLKPDRVWVGLRNGEVHYSPDAARQWDPGRFCPKPGGRGAVECIAIHPKDPDRVVVVYSGYSDINPQFSTRHVFQSGDNGESWRDISGGALDPAATVPDMPVYSAAFHLDAAGNTSLFIATAAGVLMTRDDGQHWKVLGAGLPPVDCTALAVDSTVDPPYIVVGTFGRGCWELAPPQGKPRIHVQANAAFGTVALGETGKLRIRIFNSGDKPLTVSAFDTSACPSTIKAASPLPPPIAAGAHADVELTFQPAAASAVKGTIDVKSDDPSRPVWTVAVSGVGIVAAPPPRIALEPLALQFGRIHANDLRQLMARILNAGTTPARVTAFTGAVRGFDAPAGPALPATIPLGGDLPYKVGFRPPRAYSIFFANPKFDADYQVAGDDPRAPLSLHASGTRIGGAFPLLEILLVALGVGVFLLIYDAFEALLKGKSCGED